MNINNLMAFTGSINQLSFESSNKGDFQNIMNNAGDKVEDKITKEVTTSKVEDKKDINEKSYEDIDKCIEKIEDESDEEVIIEEILILLQALNIPIEDSSSLPIKINLELSGLELSNVDLNLVNLELDNSINENDTIGNGQNIINEEILQNLDINETVNTDNIDKLLNYIVDKDGNKIKKDTLIEVIELSNGSSEENQTTGIDMVKMVFNIDSNNTTENNDDDILAKLLSSNFDENTNESKLVINEENIIISDVLNGKDTNLGSIAIENKAVNINKETVATDVVTNIRYMVKNDIQQLTVKIYPKELGEITIKLLSEDGIMKADIKSISKETYNLLNSNIEEIKKYLSNESIAIKEVNIQLYNEDTTYYNGQDLGSMFHEDDKKENYFTEENTNISIEEKAEQEEILEEISNVNLLA